MNETELQSLADKRPDDERAMLPAPLHAPRPHVAERPSL